MTLNSTDKSSSVPTLGVVAISFNEERDLPGFLGNLLPWVSEIILVDDGSIDETKAIAEAGGGKVKFIASPRKEGEYFSHQRNKGIKVAESDWLLHMDIDERVSPGLAGEILRAIVDTDKDAYRYRRLNYFLHRPMRGGGWADWNLVHLARRDVFHFSGMYHEECVVDAAQDRIGQLESMMYHFNDESYSKRMVKSNMYCQEQALVLEASGKIIKWGDLFIQPLKEFLKKYFYKKGYYDGVPGLIFSLHSSCSVFRACALLWDKQNKMERSILEDRLANEWKIADKNP